MIISRYLAIILLTLGGMVGTMSAQNPVPTSAKDIHPLPVGATLPDIAVTTIDGDPFDLMAAVKAQPTVLVYYRGGWCPFCNMQLASLQKIEPTLKEIGYQIIAISADRPSSLLPTLDRHSLTYTLLSDSTMAGARALGIAWQSTRSGRKLERASGMDHHILPVPAVIILDRKGVIQFLYANPNYRVRLDGDDLITAARAALK
ncbi:MAG: AhpC/TSA family protein [Candidatus Marinimicrobia bacterium]|nr:AhpC/TSA family protein [Candidatus Neomarinimicrobiota bacterium]